MLIDTHSHLNFRAYEKDLDEVIKRTLDNNVWAVNIGSKYDNSKKAVEIAKNYEGMFATVGLHPIHLKHSFFKVKKDLVEKSESEMKEDEFDFDRYKELALKEKVVAIGEIGLDYYYRPKTKLKTELFKEQQKKLFLEQLSLAKELNLPIVFHCRMAHQDLIDILKNNSWLKGVVHCFTGNLKEAQQYLDMGLYLGINGIMDKFNLTEVIKSAPLERILIETDCPYLTPKEEGDKRNEPIFVKHIAKKIADIRNISFEEVAEKTTQNAKTLFRI